MASKIERQVYSVNEIMIMLGIGRTKAYELVNANYFRTLKVGGQIVIPKRSFDLWLNGPIEEIFNIIDEEDSNENDVLSS
ncbi:MAG: helix-turn-helix domain-containing protein [Eubacterium sp.]|nr:helix-turn-helix domain-containing protein [Eubacterium sp.]